MENLEIFESFGFELDVFGDSNTELLIRRCLLLTLEIAMKIQLSI